MIQLEDVALEYMRGEPVLKNVTFALEPGSFHFLTGPSGAGKSSLLSLLWLQRRATRGRVSLFGQDMTHIPREGLPPFRRRIGVVLQDFWLLDHLTVAQNIALPLKVSGEKTADIKAKIRELLEWVELSDYYDALPHTLSGGQKQRVAIARAVINKPDLLLADEPTGNLDSELAFKFMYLFEALNNAGTTVLMATHDDTLIEQFNYPALYLKNRSIIQE